MAGVDGAAFGRGRPPRALVPVRRPRSGLVLATAWLARCSSTGARRWSAGSCWRRRSRFLVFRARGDVGRAARPVDDAGRRRRRPRLSARGPAWAVPAARRGGRPRLRDERPDRAPGPRSRRCAAACGRTGRSGRFRAGATPARASASSPSSCSVSAGSRSFTGGSERSRVSFFFRENLQHFAGEAYDVGRPFWFYPPAHLAEALPWSPFLPIALWRLLRSREGDERRGARFLSVWAALVLAPRASRAGRSTTTSCRSTLPCPS